MSVPDRILYFFAALGVLAVCIAIGYGTLYAVRFSQPFVRTGTALITSSGRETAPVTMTDSWVYTFNVPGTLYETSRLKESTSPHWWLSSGGMLVIENDIGHTILKVAPEASEWSWRYRRNNPLDTDAGRHPQNLFRLLTKNTVSDADVSVSFEIRAINMTDTPNRDTWSGIFVMTRYQDADNLYYAGLRQDGHAVIKKKVGGVYYTLGEVPHFQSHLTYNKYTNPNLIPGQSWMRLKVRTEDEDDGMHITLFIDQGGSGEWQEILSAVDTGTGGKMHSDPGHVGIRTDYMDVAFDDFVIDIR